MKQNKIRPLRVFISSVMANAKRPEREAVLELRTKLYEKLVSYSFFEPYILEENGPSVMDLESTYLTPLRESNLVVILLDSKQPIPEGVQIEISESRKRKISRIYFIIPGNPGDADKMKDELLQQHESNFVVPLEESLNYCKVIENAIFQQLVVVFQAYVFQQHNVTSQSDENVESNTNSAVSTLLSSSQFSKEMFNQVGLSKQTVRQLVFHEKPRKMLIDPESSLDESIQNLLDCIMNNKRLPFYWDKSMIEAIQAANSDSPLSKEFSQVLQQRLKAVRLFFSGKYTDAAELLKELIQTSEMQNLPVWILQDTLIDLRNLLAIDDETQNRWHPENPYQKRLDESSTPFYYPGIDRSLNKVYSWVREETNKLHTSSSSEERTYGSGINIYPDALADAEIFAACNGSITQIRQLPKHLNLISEMLLEQFQNRIYLKDIIQNKLLMGNTYKNINRWITRYSFLLGQFSDTDAMEILRSINSYPIPIERLAIRATALRIVGDYLTDEHFNAVWSDIYSDVTVWLAEPTLILHPAKEILGMFRYCFRIPQSDIVDFVDKLTTRAPRYYDDLSDIITGAIDHDNANTGIRSKISTALERMIPSKGNDSFSNKIEIALISLLTSWPKETRHLSEILSDSHEQYFNQHISPNLWTTSSDSEFTQFIEHQISLMNSQNKHQSGGLVTRLSTDPFISMYSAISIDAELNESYSERISSEIVDTLNNPYQTINVKQSALKLMMLTLHTSPTLNVNSLQNIDAKNLAAEDMSLFSVQTPTQYIAVLRSFIEILKLQNDDGKLLTILTLEQSAKYLFFVSEMLIDFLPIALTSNSLRKTIPQILQFLILNNNSHDRENKLTINVSKCLLILCSDQAYSDVSLGQLQRLVSDTNNSVQRQLIVQIKHLSPEIQTRLHSIKTQLLINSSYAVRDLARRDFGTDD